MIEKLAVAFFADAEAVGAAAHVFAEGADEFTLGVVNHDGLGAHGGIVNGVGDVDEALAVLGEALGVAPDEAFGGGEPIVDHLVAVGAGARDELTGAGFIGGADERRGERADGRGGGDLSEEGTTSLHRGGGVGRWD